MTLSRALFVLGLCVLNLGLAAGCTDAALYGQAPQLEPNEVELKGSLCTSDPAELGFPVKVLLLVDTSVSDADYVAQRGASIERLVRTNAGPNTSFGVIRYSSRASGTGSSSSRPPCSLLNLTQDGFTRDLDDAVLGVQCTNPNANGRDWAEALSLAHSVITGDVLRTKIGTRSRTKYVVVLMTNGAPTVSLRQEWCGSRRPALTGDVCKSRYEEAFCSGMVPTPPDCERSQYAKLVGDLREFADRSGVQEIHFHAVYQRDPETAERAPSVDDAKAIALLGEMTRVGGGSIYRFPGPGLCADGSGGVGCLFSSVNLRSTEAVFRRRELIVSNRNAHAGPDGVEVDSDGDGLPDRVELEIGTSPTNRDTDGDHLSDLVEHLLRSEGLDPLRNELTDPNGNWPKECPLPGSGNPSAFPPDRDSDGDGLTDCEEALLRSEGTLFDSDGDGIPDFLELVYGTNLIANDALDDPDADGIANVDEYRMHRDPMSRDRRPELGYRMEVKNERQTSVVSASQPWAITGVTLLGVSDDTPQGRATVFWEPPADPTQPISKKNPGSLSWRAPEDVAGTGMDRGRGEAVLVTGDGRYLLRSAAATDDAPLQVEAEVYAELLPFQATRDDVLLRRSERMCFDFSVRNVRLLPTLALDDGTEAGTNFIDLFLSEVPSNHPDGVGIMRVATFPVRYDANAKKGREVVVEQRDLLLFGD
ncbi:thrombospondin type 3 repeat-containing protein [Vulgatibacter incomptus]|uniref:Calcium-binding acidic-repeat protein (ARP) n=1 Tax=Vulgatibacter incomptus TaxID=1391653 RepID=A0A0K1PFA6_9BACT|nr:thrombospondin type 3 repeat-containing protein [Vulgatibacter incomptus]AKU92111.1 Calcium-binding acidic-repeat protein precursor (ARP) [Vulgatibacter incomptus]